MLFFLNICSFDDENAFKQLRNVIEFTTVMKTLILMEHFDMNIQKNVFTYICYALFIVFALFQLTNFIGVFTDVYAIDVKYNLLCFGGITLSFVIILLILNMLSKIKLSCMSDDIWRTVGIIIELITVMLIIAAVIVVRRYMVMYADSETIQSFISDNRINEALKISEYIADYNYTGLFDYVIVSQHNMSYIILLGISFAIFGSGINSIVTLNLILSVISMIIIYLLARISAGRIAAYISILCYGFVPGFLNDYMTIYETGILEIVFLGALLLFALYMRQCNKCSELSVSNVICGILMGVECSLALLFSLYSALLILGMFLFMMFKHWKQGLIFLFSVIVVTVTSVALIAYFGNYITDLTTYFEYIYYNFNFDFMTLYNNLLVLWNDIIRYNDVVVITPALGELITMIILIYSVASTIVLFFAKRNIIQVLMFFVCSICIISTITGIGTPEYSIINVSFILVMSYGIQYLYTIPYEKRFAVSVDYANCSEVNVESANAELAASDTKDENFNIFDVLPISKFVSIPGMEDESACKIHAVKAQSNYKAEMWEKRKQRIAGKSAKNK